MIGQYKVAGFKVISRKDGSTLDHFMLMRNGAREYVTNNRTVLYSGVAASLEYRKKLDFMRQISEMRVDIFIEED